MLTQRHQVRNLFSNCITEKRINNSIACFWVQPVQALFLNVTSFKLSCFSWPQACRPGSNLILFTKVTRTVHTVLPTNLICYKVKISFNYLNVVCFLTTLNYCSNHGRLCAFSYQLRYPPEAVLFWKFKYYSLR